MKTTPGFLRGQAVNSIIGIMHTAAQGGVWAAESVKTEVVLPPGEAGRTRTTIVFAVGVIDPGWDIRIPDERERVTITIEDSSGL